MNAPQITQAQLKHGQPLEALEQMQGLVVAITQAVEARDYPKASTLLPQITDSLPAFKKQSELYRWALGPLQREIVALSWTHTNEARQ